MTRIIAVLLMAVAAATACSSSVSSTPARQLPRTEEFYGQVTGALAAEEIKGTIPVTFPVMRWAGPVSATARNVTLGSDKDRTVRVFESPAGNIAVRYGQRSLAPGAPVVTGQVHGDCFISVTVATGNYEIDGTVSTGQFKGTSGHGSYALIFLSETRLPAGRKKCSTADPGTVIPSGAVVTFTASGPLTP